jgi:tetratricopeptide (TPR) repeat protein
LEYRRLERQAQLQLLINRGVTHLRRSEWQPALNDFDAVIALDNRQAEAHLNRGAALVQLGRHGPAIAAITEALGLGVREPHKAYFNRGAAREALGDIRGAYEDYNTALEIEPNWGPANAELARFARTRRDHLAAELNRRSNQ